MHSKLIAGFLALAVSSSCCLKVHPVSNGPIGDSATENIKIHYSEAGSLSPNGRKSVYGPPKPEYGGSKEWRYKGPDIEGIPEGVQPFQDADKLPVGFTASECPFKNNGPIGKLLKAAIRISNFLNGLGVPGAPDVLNCTASPTLKELMACVQITVNEGKELFQTAQEIAVLNTRVMSGGRPADAALARLKTLASRPLAKTLMKALGANVCFSASRSLDKYYVSGTTMMCTMLMQKELTPDRQRWQAGSIVTTVTDLPVASEINDTRTGGFGHVNVHRSDKIIEELSKGIDPVATLYGGLGVEGRTDVRVPLSPF